jgi:hypothetical protein
LLRHSGSRVAGRVGIVAYAEGAARRYYPYGEEQTVTPHGTEKFATYTRDEVSGLDYAWNRFYHSPTVVLIAFDLSTRMTAAIKLSESLNSNWWRDTEQGRSLRILHELAHAYDVI